MLFFTDPFLILFHIFPFCLFSVCASLLIYFFLTVLSFSFPLSFLSFSSLSFLISTLLSLSFLPFVSFSSIFSLISFFRFSYQHRNPATVMSCNITKWNVSLPQFPLIIWCINYFTPVTSFENFHLVCGFYLPEITSVSETWSHGTQRPTNESFPRHWLESPCQFFQLHPRGINTSVPSSSTQQPQEQFTPLNLDGHVIGLRFSKKDRKAKARRQVTAK